MKGTLVAIAPNRPSVHEHRLAQVSLTTIYQAVCVVETVVLLRVMA